MERQLALEADAGLVGEPQISTLDGRVVAKIVNPIRGHPRVLPSGGCFTSFIFLALASQVIGRPASRASRRNGESGFGSKPENIYSV
jgi:hypothetical protein